MRAWLVALAGYTCAAVVGCASREPANTDSEPEAAESPRWVVREHRTPVTLTLNAAIGGREAEESVSGEHVVKLDYATPTERALHVSAPGREQRVVVTDEGAFVVEDGWRRPLWRVDEPAAGAADLHPHEGRREWRVDAAGCLHVHSEWTVQTEAPAPWNDIAYDEQLVWCDGAERSRTLRQRVGSTSQISSWSSE